jgi:hypothetical protein
MSSVPVVVQQDVGEFVRKLEASEVDLMNLGLGRLALSEALEGLRVVYGLEPE